MYPFVAKPAPCSLSVHRERVKYSVAIIITWQLRINFQLTVLVTLPILRDVLMLQMIDLHPPKFGCIIFKQVNKKHIQFWIFLMQAKGL